jgi:hypothetical protein
MSSPHTIHTTTTSEIQHEEVPLAVEQKVEEAPLEGEALEEAILHQFEYYLSREYLSQDPNLVHQMQLNPEMYVPITIIMEMAPVKADLDIVVKTLRKSTQLIVNENGTMVKPNIKVTRNTVILRDISTQTTTVEEIKTIFNEHCPPVISIRPEVGDCWFVTFNTEEDALKALDFVRNQKFKGNVIKARIKTENVLRALIPPPSDDGAVAMAKIPQFPSHYYPPMGYHRPHGNWIPHHPHGYQYSPYEHGHPDHRRRGQGRQRKEYRNKYNTTNNNTNVTSNHTSPHTSPTIVHELGYEGQVATNRGEHDRKRRPRNRSKTEGQSKPVPIAHAPPQLGLANFPPLVSSSAPKQKPTTGYAKDFTKFTREELINIVSSMQVSTQPPQSFPEEHCIATLSEPNTKLSISARSTTYKDHVAGSGGAAQEVGNSGREKEAAASPVLNAGTQAGQATPAPAAGKENQPHNPKKQPPQHSQQPQPQQQHHNHQHQHQHQQHHPQQQHNQKRRASDSAVDVSAKDSTTAASSSSNNRRGSRGNAKEKSGGDASSHSHSHSHSQPHSPSQPHTHSQPSQKQQHQPHPHQQGGGRKGGGASPGAARAGGGGHHHQKKKEELAVAGSGASGGGGGGAASNGGSASAPAASQGGAQAAAVAPSPSQSQGQQQQQQAGAAPTASAAASVPASAPAVTSPTPTYAQAVSKLKESV